ncbi:hypothetical protein RI367_000275 [Sorochytrium milnesiophthora]
MSSSNGDAPRKLLGTIDSPPRKPLQTPPPSSSTSFAIPAAPVSKSPPNAIPRQQDNTLLSPAFPSLSSAQRVSSPLSQARQKVALAPGHSPMDWAKLQSSGTNLTNGVMPGGRYTMAEVAKHKTEQDAWSVINGKVFNISPYLKFHPGGVKQLMRAAGKDGTKLFMSIHSWVNADKTLEACFLGYLVPE